MFRVNKFLCIFLNLKGHRTSADPPTLRWVIFDSGWRKSLWLVLTSWLPPRIRCRNAVLNSVFVNIGPRIVKFLPLSPQVPWNSNPYSKAISSKRIRIIVATHPSDHHVSPSSFRHVSDAERHREGRHGFATRAEGEMAKSAQRTDVKRAEYTMQA